MNIKNIFKRKKTKENETLDISKMEHKLMDIPKVVFEDLELQVTIGQWLGILSSQKGFGNSEFTIYTHLNAEELMERMDIPFEKLEEITAKFGFLLRLTGIESEETCILNKFNKDEFSFNCHFDNSGNDAKISLRWESMMDCGPEFIIEYPNERKTYDYHKEYKDSPTRLELQHYTINNPLNGNSYHRLLSPYNAYFTLENCEYSFLVKIGKPESIETDVFSYYAFSLENEEELKQYLLGLTFPFEIREVYKKICEISVKSIGEYPNFIMELKRTIDEKNSKQTDLISLKHGQLNKFVTSKNEKTIAFDGDGNWSYCSPKLIISQTHNGNINYSLNEILSNELSNVSSPFEQFNEVSQEVEQVKRLTKTMLKSKEVKN